MPGVTLYHAPPSHYWQLARLVLAEKGVAWRSKFIAPGPPIFESYEPWYMRLNPSGTVPNLVHNGHCNPETIDIARYVDAAFEGPPLSPADSASGRKWNGG